MKEATRLAVCAGLASLAMATLGGCAATHPKSMPAPSETAMAHDREGPRYALAVRFEGDPQGSKRKELEIHAYGSSARIETESGDVVAVAAYEPLAAVEGEPPILKVAVSVIHGFGSPNAVGTGVFDTYLVEGQPLRLPDDSGRAAWLTFERVEP